MEITPRNCVENFWLSNVDRFLRSDVSQVEYCESRGLKRSSMNGWMTLFREKYPEKFEKREALKSTKAQKKQDQVFVSESNNKSLFVEVHQENQISKEISSFPLLPKLVIEEKLIIETSYCKLYFSTFPELEWLTEFVRGLK